MKGKKEIQTDRKTDSKEPWITGSSRGAREKPLVIGPMYAHAYMHTYTDL